MSAVLNNTRGFGAAQEEWTHFSDVLGLTEDLLPVVSNPNLPTSPHSKIGPNRGKVPSEARASGVGGMDGWTGHRATADDVARWARNADLGICIQTRDLRAIDIDIADPVVSAGVVEGIEMILGPLPKRMRANSGKCLLIFRLPGSLLKRDFHTVGGKIEFLANGQQFVAVGTHPSGARYEWEGGLPRADAVPTLTLDELEMVWSALHGAYAAPDEKPLRPVSGTHARVGATGAAGAGASVDQAQDSRATTLGLVTQRVVDEVHDAMSVFTAADADDYSGRAGWFVIGNALKSLAQAGFEADALEMWHNYSAMSPKYEYQKVQDKWDYDLDPTRSTYKTIFTLAQERGWENPRSAAARLESQRERSARIGREGGRDIPTQRMMTGSEMLEELVYLADGSRVAFLNEPRFALPLAEFKNFTAGSMEKVEDTKRRVHRVDQWMRSPERKSVRTLTFAPGREVICPSPDGDTALNLWKPREEAVPEDWETLVEPFFDHVAYLVPDKAERDRFLDWLAHIEQEPGVLPHTHYLLVAKQTGIGRNWLAYALARCFAGYTALGYNLAESLRTGFNGELSQRLLAVVDELHEGGPGATSRTGAEKLKSLLTESTRRINPKYGRQHTEFNSCRFLMFSNHEAALPLAENDRRVVVIENPTERRGADRYAFLYRLLDRPGFGAALAWAFRQRDISGFNPGGVAPMNAAKERTIRAGRSEVEAAVRDVAGEWASDCITSSQLQRAVADALGGKSWSIQSAGVAAGLVKYKGRVRISGVASHIWILRNMNRWSESAPPDIAAEVKRGEAALHALDDVDELW